MLNYCKEYFTDRALKDVFVLTCDRMRKYEGNWHLERKFIFPAHIFLESENEEILLKEFKKCGRIAGQKARLLRISREEEEFLKRLCGEERHLEMSRGIIRDGITRVTEGPLRGMEGWIRKIDRHKRLARVGMKEEPDFSYVLAGLEITEKLV